MRRAAFDSVGILAAVQLAVYGPNEVSAVATRARWCGVTTLELDPPFSPSKTTSAWSHLLLAQVERKKTAMRELDVPASRPAFHAPGRVLALRYFGETSRGRLMAVRRDFRRSRSEPVLVLCSLRWLKVLRIPP